MKLPKFEAGQLVSAKQWNAIAREVNRIWATETGPELVLTKGSPWKIRAKSGVFGDGIPEFNGPVWQIYVYRPLGVGDYDLEADPTAVFLTGPFTQTGTLSTKRIAKLKQGTGGTVVDSTFASNAGINLASGYGYSQQRMAKVDGTGKMLFIGINEGATWLDGQNGVFWCAEPENGTRLFSPFANIEALVPGITNTVNYTGIASTQSTIALSAGTQAGFAASGITLYDTSGTPIETSPGNYLFQDGTADSYFWLIGNDGAAGYIFESDSDFGTQPYVHAITAGLGGIAFDSVWDANAGTGDSANQFEPPSLFYGDGTSTKIIRTVTSWNGVTPTSPISFIQSNGAARGLYVYDAPVTPPLVAAMIVTSSGPSDGDAIFTSSDLQELHLFLDSNLVSLTVSGGDFNAEITDAKYFRARGDGTHQIIVCGEFTEYRGEPVPYLVYIDQDGNRLSDLEWP